MGEVNMADIQVHINPDEQLTIHTAVGKVSRDEIIGVQEKYYANDPTPYLLWDFREADMSALSSDDLKQIMLVGRRNAHRRRNGKTAILVSSDLSFGLSRMYEAYSEIYEHPADHWVTKVYADAMKWLLG